MAGMRAACVCSSRPGCMRTDVGASVKRMACMCKGISLPYAWCMGPFAVRSLHGCLHGCFHGAMVLSMVLSRVLSSLEGLPSMLSWCHGAFHGALHGAFMIRETSMDAFMVPEGVVSTGLAAHKVLPRALNEHRNAMGHVTSMQGGMLPARSSGLSTFSISSCLSVWRWLFTGY
eukprot:715889-Pelagomonas_calceolata.AAC.5